MQRKSDILMPYKKQRSGFAMILAIAFLLVMATIMGLMMSMTTLTTKRSGDIYFQEQAHLLAKSAVENIIYNHSITAGSCPGTPLTLTHSPYTITANIAYFGICGGTAITTPESIGNMIIDIYVTAPASQTGSSEDITFHRRTMQKL